MKTHSGLTKCLMAALVPELIVMGLAALIYLPNMFTGRVITTDDCLYAWVGRNIVTGKGIADWQGPHTMFPPGYPFLIGVTYLVTNSLETACRLVVSLSTIGSVLLIMLFCSRLCGRWAGIAAGIAASINPGFIGMSYNGGSEMPFVFLCCLTMYMGMKLINGYPLAGLAGGLAIGAGYLVRPEALLFAPVFLVVIMASKLVRRPAAVALFFLGMAVCVVPYAWFLKQHMGHWALSGKSKTLVVDNPNVTSDPEKALYKLEGKQPGYTGDDVKLTSETAKTAVSPMNYLRNSKKAAGAVVRMAGFPVVLLMVWACALVVRRRKLPPMLIPSLLPLPLMAAMPLFFIRDRYLAAVIPMVIIWGIWAFYFGTASKYRWVRAVAVLLLLAAVPVGLRSAGHVLEEINNDPYEQMMAGEWIAGHAKADGAVMSRKPWTPFYADRPWVITPLAGYKDTIDFARTRGVSYLVIDERYTGKLRPNLRFLLDTGKTPAELRLMKTIEKEKYPKLLIYEVLPSN